MPRQAKALAQHVREGSFRARRHGALLAGSELRWDAFAKLQRRYVGCSCEEEQHAVALGFERAVRGAQRQVQERAAPNEHPKKEETAEPKRAAPPAIARLALSPNEAAEALGVSRDFFDQHIACELRIIRRGRRKLVPIRELERWLCEHGSFALEGVS